MQGRSVCRGKIFRGARACIARGVQRLPAGPVPGHHRATAVQAVRAVNANIILSVGGGSIIDAAKAVIICLRENINTVEGLAARIGKISEGPGGPSHISIPRSLDASYRHLFCNRTTKIILLFKNKCTEIKIGKQMHKGKYERKCTKSNAKVFALALEFVSWV